MAKREIWHPPAYTKQDVYAIQALAMYAQGLRDQPPGPSDVQRALDWIINNAAQTYEEPFLRPGQDDAVHYVLGRQSVGRAIVKMMKLKPELVK